MHVWGSIKRDKGLCNDHNWFSPYIFIKTVVRLWICKEFLSLLCSFIWRVGDFVGFLWFNCIPRLLYNWDISCQIQQNFHAGEKLKTSFRLQSLALRLAECQLQWFTNLTEFRGRSESFLGQLHRPFLLISSCSDLIDFKVFK